MKKIFILLVLILTITGCNKKEEEIKSQNSNEVIVEEPEVPKYVDENKTKIGLYTEKNGKLELITEYKTNLNVRTDIGVFQLYPSNNQEIKLSKGFGSSFYDTWVSNPNYQNIKIGFNIKYSVGNTKISYNILDPSTTKNKDFKHIYTYLYDDYFNRNKSWYSHITEEEYNKDSLFTSIKLFSYNINYVTSKIYLTVFTYDTLDDFDENNEYRGNSSYTITICDIDKTCG